jgi:type II secretory pathway pseudopilin PulG
MVELLVGLAIMAVLTVIALPNVSEWLMNQRLKSATRQAAKSLAWARGEAIRTGDVHVVFFGLDSQGVTLATPGGAVVPILILNDGLPGSANQNCKIDAGEPFEVVLEERDVRFGVDHATGTAPADGGGGGTSAGWSFTDPGGNSSSFVVFRPQGVPLSATAACAIGAAGSGAGAVYLTNGERDFAVVLTPLGTVRVHSWSGGGWAG